MFHAFRDLIIQPGVLFGLPVCRVFTPGRDLCGATPQHNEAAHVAGDVLHPDPGFGACDADRAYHRPAHVVGPRAKDVFHPGPYFGFGPVAALRLRGQRLAAPALAVDVALQFPIPQLASISSER